ncbi:hypothetical protein B0T18DRAFT_395074 [Schizothecium vesticola]|uniref:Uncharacterized protein n=1 Tax=Schizothecium vesticola TaxID=314040 RepID=A0AA40BR99_9PEZI|nr:hypothetical protein B0T18DRAFT_395074 [Schizothecium vesticola]
MALLEPRQPLITLVPRVTVTQIIVRPSTTLTAVVTLGNDLITQTPAAPPAPVDTLPPSVVVPTTSSQPLTNEALGAILGSVFGFLVIVLPLAYLCLRRPTWRRRRRYYSSSSSDSGESSTGTEVSETPRRGPPPRGQRGGWAPQPFMPVLIPPPARIPPRRHAPYRHTARPQIPGVRVYP